MWDEKETKIPLNSDSTKVQIVGKNQFTERSRQRKEDFSQ